jgi:glyoxylase I family protein
MQIQRFLHASLNVTDLAQSDHFYQSVLGFKPNPDRNLNFAGSWYQIGDFQLHLIVVPSVPPIGQPPIGQSPIVLEAKWGRNRHLAFAVASVAAVKARLEQYDWAFQLSSSGRPAVFVCDPDNNVIELGEV